MSPAYTCPVCRTNSSEFSLVYKLIQDIIKDPYSGKTTFVSDELEMMARPDGQPDLDIRCGVCGYVGQEAAFARQARQGERRAR